MVEETKKKKNILKFILVVIGVMIYQVLAYQLTVYLFCLLSNALPDVEYIYLLMIHHCFEFLVAFIPTIVLHLLSKLDFGYHLSNFKKGMRWLIIGATFSLIVSLITALFGARTEFDIGNFVFQLVFSGFGEEILYRSLPLVLFTFAYGKETSITIKGKYDFDFGIIISAILFSLAHINFQFGYMGCSYSITQMICAFGAGIIFGYTYKRTNNIWVCMVIHGAYNVITMLFPLIFSLF